MPEADASPLHSGLFLDLDGTLADSLTIPLDQLRADTLLSTVKREIDT